MLKRLTLTNFMDAADETYIFYDRKKPGHLNIQITGDSRTGKTRILEALSVCLGGMSSSGDTRPHYFISEGAKEATVRVELSSGVEIERSLQRAGRAVRVVVRHRSAVVATDTLAADRLLGLSRWAMLSMLIPGFYMSMCPSRQWKVCDEIFRGRFPASPPDLKLSFLIYPEFKEGDKNLFNLWFCYAAQRRFNPNHVGAVFIDNVESFVWCDEYTPPPGVQLITTRRIKGAPLGIRF